MNEFNMIETVKLYLGQYKYIKPNLRRIDKRISELKTMMPSVTAQYKERVSGGSPSSSVEQFVINLEEDMQRLLNKQKYWLELKQKIEDFIDNADIADYEKRILQDRYISNLHWDEVAYSNNYSDRSAAIKVHNRTCIKLYHSLITE